MRFFSILHMDVSKQRLEQEYDMLIINCSSVRYQLYSLMVRLEMKILLIFLKRNWHFEENETSD